MEELRILSPTAILGYGFPESSFQEGMRRKPDLIAVDAGSTDPGPYYLGAGVSFTEYRAVKRDLAIILQAALEAGIPVFIGSAGGSGGRPHLEWSLRIIQEIAHEKRLRFRLATIAAEIPRETVASLWQQHRLKPLPPAPDLSSADIEQTERIVGQMGVEPFLRAMESGAQVILAGRSYDPAVFAAYGVARGFDPGLSIHLGKILECAAIAATPGSGSDCLMGYLHRSDFEVEPLNPARRCTPLSVAAHTLYEKSNPYELPGPGGVLDLHAARFDAVTENRVRVTGSRFLPSGYRVKLEGVKRIGYRTVAIAAARDPLMIREIDRVVSGVRERVADNFRADGFDYFLDFKIYGRNGVMGSLEPGPVSGGHELGIIIEAVAASRELADTVCGFARSTMLHFGYPGRIATAGNLAFPYSPSDFPAGPVYVFSIYHLAEVTAEELFPVTVREIEADSRANLMEEAIE